MHPAASGEAIGAASLRDFRYFTSFVSSLEGGVYLNCGSAVMLPEVFLKAVALVRNRGISLDGLTTVNFDFARLYRPETNVVRRPVAGIGRGYSFTGHHEILLPLLAAALTRQLIGQGPKAKGNQRTSWAFGPWAFGLYDRKLCRCSSVVRACGSYPQCPGFKSLHRHQFCVRNEAMGQ